MIWIKGWVLECDFVVIVGVFGDPLFDPLCFGVIIHHPIFAEGGRD